jgi:hypothetical protein
MVIESLKFIGVVFEKFTVEKIHDSFLMELG